MLEGTPDAECEADAWGPKRDDGLKQPTVGPPKGHPSMRPAAALSRSRINVTRGGATFGLHAPRGHIGALLYAAFNRHSVCAHATLPPGDEECHG